MDGTTIPTAPPEPAAAHHTLGAAVAARLQFTVEAAADGYMTTVGAILSRNNRRRVTSARRTAMAIMREHFRLSTPEVGELFGRDHSTVATVTRGAEFDARYWPVLELVRKEYPNG